MRDVMLVTQARLPGRDGAWDVAIADGQITSCHPARRRASAGVAGEGSKPGNEGSGTIHADGRWLLPGFWDEHVHFGLWAEMSRRLDVGAAPSAAAVAHLVAAALPGRPAGEPLIAVGFRDGLWPDAPGKALLDAVAPDTEVYVFSGDLHAIWLNSAALARQGLAGHPTGHLREADCFRVMWALQDVDEATRDRWILEAAAQAAARGVTGIVDLDLTWGFDDWPRRTAGGAPLRVAVGVYEDNLDRAIAAGYRSGQSLDAAGLITVGPLKVISDGSLNTRTAWCFDPYPDVTGPDAYGVASVPPDHLEALMAKGWAAGFLPAIHAIGDRSNAAALDAFDRVGCPGRIEHAQLLRREDVARMAALGIVASVQPEHALDDRDVADHHWAGRTDRAFPLRSLLDAGVTLALGSDAPVAPLDPWLTIGAAVARTKDGRPPWHAEQGIPVQAALRASARCRDTVAPGQVADLQLVERDPLAVAPEELRTMPVALTLLAGRVTHSAL
jgi:predicted amidohydrolase YtcJ